MAPLFLPPQYNTRLFARTSAAGQTIEDMKQALARGCAGEYVKNMGRLGISQPEAARMAAEYKEGSV